MHEKPVTEPQGIQISKYTNHSCKSRLAEISLEIRNQCTEIREMIYKGVTLDHCIEHRCCGVFAHSLRPSTP